MPLYMRMEGLQPDGVGTIPSLGGRGGWFTIDSFSHSISRDISVEVGAATNSDSGATYMSPYSVSRRRDGASPHLQTYLHKPGSDGFTVHIALTKPGRNGGDPTVTCLWTLQHARFSSYSDQSEQDGATTEHITIVCDIVREEDWIEEPGGGLTKHQVVEYDLRKAKLTSAAKP